MTWRFKKYDWDRPDFDGFCKFLAYFKKKWCPDPPEPKVDVVPDSFFFNADLPEPISTLNDIEVTSLTGEGAEFFEPLDGGGLAYLGGAEPDTLDLVINGEPTEAIGIVSA